jgi:hypothetical protein
MTPDRVLIVEDESALRTIVSTIFSGTAGT